MIIAKISYFERKNFFMSVGLLRREGLCVAVLVKNNILKKRWVYHLWFPWMVKSSTSVQTNLYLDRTIPMREKTSGQVVKREDGKKSLKELN